MGLDQQDVRRYILKKAARTICKKVFMVFYTHIVSFFFLISHTFKQHRLGIRGREHRKCEYYQQALFMSFATLSYGSVAYFETIN